MHELQRLSVSLLSFVVRGRIAIKASEQVGKCTTYRSVPSLANSGDLCRCLGRRSKCYATLLGGSHDLLWTRPRCKRFTDSAAAGTSPSLDWEVASPVTPARIHLLPTENLNFTQPLVLLSQCQLFFLSPLPEINKSESTFVLRLAGAF